MNSSRRALFRLLPAAGVVIASDLFGQANKTELIEVTPTEDLMREHGLLKRILLIYDEVGRRIEGRRDFPPDAVTKSASFGPCSGSSSMICEGCGRCRSG